MFDPSLTNGSDWRAGGVHGESNTSGLNSAWFEIFDKCDSDGTSCSAGRAGSGTFGKVNGLGDRNQSGGLRAERAIIHHCTCERW